MKMINMKRNILSALKWNILLLIFLCFNISCHHKKETPPNPCLGITRTTAAFKVEESIQGDPTNFWNYKTDTIASDYATFTVTSQVDSVIWKIGAGVYKSKSFTLGFLGVADKTIIPVTLIVFRKPQLDCFANDKSSDTLTKVIYITNSFKIFGKYKGAWQEAPLDSFIIQISYDTARNVTPHYILTNFDKTGCHKHVGATGLGYRKIWIYGPSDSCTYVGNAGMHEDAFIEGDTNKITATYGTATLINNVFTTYPHTFKGRRIQ
jgi:hypothetical protein